MRACISKDGYVARHYRTCRIIRAKRPSIIKPESAEKVRALLKANFEVAGLANQVGREEDALALHLRVLADRLSGAGAPVEVARAHHGSRLSV